MESRLFFRLACTYSRGYPHQALSPTYCMQNARSSSQLYLDICQRSASCHDVYYYLVLVLYLEICGATSVQASKCQLVTCTISSFGDAMRSRVLKIYFRIVGVQMRSAALALLANCCADNLSTQNCEIIVSDRKPERFESQKTSAISTAPIPTTAFKRCLNNPSSAPEFVRAPASRWN